MRSSTSDPTEKLLLEIPAGTGDQDLADKYYYYFDYLPPRSGGVTFSYRVYAVFLGTDGSRTLSAPNPTAAATALTPVAPPKLKSRVTVSQLMGRLRVTLDWGAVNERYGVPGLPDHQARQHPRCRCKRRRSARPPSPSTTSFPARVARSASSRVYEGFLKDDTVRSCDLVATRGP